MWFSCQHFPKIKTNEPKALVTVWLLMVEVFSSWDQIHGNTFCPAKRWNVEEATHTHTYTQIHYTLIHKYTNTLWWFNEALKWWRSNARTRACWSQNWSRQWLSEPIRNSCNYRVAVVVYIKLLLQIVGITPMTCLIFREAFGLPVTCKRILSLSTTLLKEPLLVEIRSSWYGNILHIDVSKESDGCKEL